MSTRTSGVIRKQEILRELIARIGSDLQQMSAAQRAVVDGATHEENRPENDKDTRALEQTYLARGQAQRVVELQHELSLLKTLELRPFPAGKAVALGALVSVENEREVVSYFLAPAGGGLRLEISEREVRIVTPQSPIGRALLGKGEGDEFELRTPQGVTECTIASVT